MQENKNIEVKKDKAVGEKKVLPAGKYYLRVKRSHPDGKFRIQGHVLSTMFKEVELNAEEAKELCSVGCQAWVEIGDAKLAAADAKLHNLVKESQASAKE